MFQEWVRSQECGDLLRILLGAELFFLISRSRDILVALKGRRQRTPAEQNRVARGLIRSIGLEALLFVPASAFLLSMLKPLALSTAYLDSIGSGQRTAIHTAVGLVSYGFPFATVKSVATRVALNTLKEFSTIAANSNPATPVLPSSAAHDGGDV